MNDINYAMVCVSYLHINNSTKPIWKSDIIPIRKHLPIRSLISLPNKMTNTDPAPKLSRNLNMGKKQQNKLLLTQIEKDIQEGNLTEAISGIESILKEATSQIKPQRTAQKLFDKECLKQRKLVLQALQHTRAPKDDKSIECKHFAEERRKYKTLLRRKKQIYWEQEGKPLRCTKPEEKTCPGVYPNGMLAEPFTRLSQ